jgi:Cytochrome c oxidase subunit IIa family
MTPPEQDPAEEQGEHPKGALVFILIYLVVIVAFWVNTYLRLWIRG